MNTRTLEARLAEQLKKDQARRSRHRGTQQDGTVVIEPSNAAIGLAIAINQRTGEDVNAIMDRVGNE